MSIWDSRPNRPGLEGLSKAMIATIAQPLLVLDRDLRVLTANPSFLRTFEVPEEDTTGRLVYELGNSQWDIPELRRLLEKIIPHNEHVEDYRVEHEFPRIGRKVMLLNGRRIEGEDQRPQLILLAINDVTELEATRHELEGHKEYSEKIIDSLREALLVLDWDLRIKHANQPFYEAFRVTPQETEGRLIYELGNKQWDIPELRRLLEQILPERNSFDDFEVRHDFETIGPKVMLLNARRLDHLNLILLAIEDITERKRAEEQQQTLSRELAHRVKNVITLVDSMARQTLSRSQSLADFADAFHGRLRSVARAQGQLLSGQWRNVDIWDLAMATLDGCAGDPSQVEMQGEPVSLLSHQAMAVSLTLHELCTNAIKYGALSSQAGRVAITWSVEVIEGVRHVRLEWRETGGPGVEPPSRKGFGTQLIENLCPHELHGEVQLDFDQAGLRCELLFPLR